MAIKQVKGGGGEITAEEFKELMKRFDRDGDGRISKEELRVFIRCVGGRFSGWKCGQGIRQADANGDGFIDESEIDNLVIFAQKRLGLKIVPY